VSGSRVGSPLRIDASPQISPYFWLQFQPYTADKVAREAGHAQHQLPPAVVNPLEDDLRAVAEPFNAYANVRSFLSRDVDGRVTRLDTFSKMVRCSPSLQGKRNFAHDCLPSSLPLACEWVGSRATHPSPSATSASVRPTPRSRMVSASRSSPHTSRPFMAGVSAASFVSLFLCQAVCA
jgi:hypothetical protein